MEYQGRHIVLNQTIALPQRRGTPWSHRYVVQRNFVYIYIDRYIHGRTHTFLRRQRSPTQEKREHNPLVHLSVSEFLIIEPCMYSVPAAACAPPCRHTGERAMGMVHSSHPRTHSLQVEEESVSASGFLSSFLYYSYLGFIFGLLYLTSIYVLTHLTHSFPINLFNHYRYGYIMHKTAIL